MEDKENLEGLSADLLRGHTDTIVLGVLLEGDAYGFEIYNRILARSGGRYEPKEATLYSGYRRLLAAGRVSSYWGDETLGARRKYYRITEAGIRTLRDNLREWASAREIIDSLLPGEVPEGGPNMEEE